MDYKDTIQFSTLDGKKKKAQVRFNQIKPYINAVKGFMAQNRREAQYIARDESPLVSKQYSLYANSLKYYIRENNNSDQVETQQDGDTLIDGYGAIETAVTYAEGFATTDPNGEVLCMRLDPLSVWWDNYARQTNLTDAKFCGYSQVYHIDEALDLFNDSNEQDFEQFEEDNQSDYSYFPRGGAYDKYKEVMEWTDEEAHMVKVHFYKWYDVEKFYRCDNPVYTLTNPQAVQMALMQLELIAQEIGDENGLFEFNPRDEILNFDSKIKGLLEEAFGEFIEVFEHPKKVFYEAVISGDKVFTAFASISQQGFSVQFKTGDYDERNKIWTGMVQSMMEPSDYYNKALTELMFVISANSKGGYFVEKSAVEDIRDFEANVAKTDTVVVVEDGALSNGSIQPKKSPFAPTGYESIIQLSDAAISQVNGIDRTFLGSSENRMETAALQRRRIKQVVSTLACYFDAITLFQKLNARILLDFMRVYAENNPNALFHVIGEDGKKEFVKLSQDKLMAEFDIRIQEAPQTAEEKQEQAQMLVTMADKLMAIGDPTGKVIYSIALKYLPLESQDIDKLREILVPQDQAIDPAYVQQLEAQLQQATSEANQVQLQKIVADIAETQAKTQKTLNDMLLNRQKTTADVEKTEQETIQTAIENELVVNQATKVNVNI